MAHGAKTLDVDVANFPNVVGDIASPQLTESDSYKGGIGDNKKFKNVVFECVPADIFDTAEKCDAIVENIKLMSAPSVKVKIKTGASAATAWAENINQSLTNGGFTVTGSEVRRGTQTIKARRRQGG
jgi:hypothetical protein